MESQDIIKYCKLMEEIKTRKKVIDLFLGGSLHAAYKETTTESVCLQFRKILELIALGSLVANKKAYTDAYNNFSKAWNARLLIQDIERINSQFYPRPIIEHSDPNSKVKVHFPRKDDYLTKDEFIKIYEKCGALMHAFNPYGSQQDYKYFDSKFKDWDKKIVGLLSVHEIRLVDDPNLYLVHMTEEGNDKVHHYTLAPTSPPDA